LYKKKYQIYYISDITIRVEIEKFNIKIYILKLQQIFTFKKNIIMLSHPIIKSLIILSAFVASIYSDTCKYFKEPKYCSSYVLRSKKNNERSYVSPLIYKSKTNKKIETQDEFNQYMDNLAYNPVYPLDLKIFEEDFGCPNYDYNKFKVRYVNSYQCNYIYYKDCNTKVLDKLPKLCKNSCDAYLKSITEIFSNKESCPTTATVEQLTNRENKLNEIREHCSNTTYSRTENCLLGVGDELKYCGYKYEKDFIEYCNKNINEPCCQQEIEEKGDSILLKIILYAFIGVVVLLIVVLMVLKIYSVIKIEKMKFLDQEYKKLKREEIMKETNIENNYQKRFQVIQLIFHFFKEIHQVQHIKIKEHQYFHPMLDQQIILHSHNVMVHNQNPHSHHVGLQNQKMKIHSFNAMDLYHHNKIIHHRIDHSPDLELLQYHVLHLQQIH